MSYRIKDSLKKMLVFIINSIHVIYSKAYHHTHSNHSNKDTKTK